MKRVLITGGTGFIGQHTITPLIERDYEVHVVSHSSRRNFLPRNVVFHAVDLLDCSEHRQLMKTINPSHLLHGAWYTENGKFWDAVENVYWLKASISLVDAFYAEGGSRVLGLGTCAEYDWNDGLCIEGKTAEIPLSLYGKTKKATYDCLSALSQAQSKDFIWARIFFPYGAGESEKRLLPYVITNLLRDQEARCTHGNQLRDFLHVENIGNALAAVLDSEVTGVINIGSGIPLTIREMVSCIAVTLKKEALALFGAIPEPAYSPPKIIADITRLTTEVRWVAKLSLAESLAKTIDWWRTQQT